MFTYKKTGKNYWIIGTDMKLGETWEYSTFCDGALLEPPYNKTKR